MISEIAIAFSLLQPVAFDPYGPGRHCKRASGDGPSSVKMYICLTERPEGTASNGDLNVVIDTDDDAVVNYRCETAFLSDGEMKTFKDFGAVGLRSDQTAMSIMAPQLSFYQRMSWKSLSVDRCTWDVDE